jgi:hypothetical protein
MSIISSVRNFLGMQHTITVSQVTPQVLAIHRLLFANGVSALELNISELFLHFESADDASFVTGFALSHNVTTGLYNLNFNWGYKDIFVGWSDDQKRYYVTARDNSQHLSESVYFDHLDDIQQGLDSLESKIQRAVADY